MYVAINWIGGLIYNSYVCGKGDVLSQSTTVFFYVY